MSAEHVEVIVEEPSMEAALRILLPKVLVRASFHVYVHQCKDELMKRLLDRLRGYSRWIPSTWRILVVVDCDDDDCLMLKNRLEKASRSAGLLTKSKALGPEYAVVNRIAVEELEAWYFGDWKAVREVYPRVPSTIPQQAKYRNSDAISGGTWEAFERILKRAGYFQGGLRKIEAARAIALKMDTERNSSRSFRVLIEALNEMSMSR